MILRCDAVLFDLDGVLVDSAACVEETWRRWAMRHQLDPAVVIAEAHGRRSVDTIRRVAPQLAADAAGMRSIAVASTLDCATLSGATTCIAKLDKLDVISASAADGITLLAHAR